MIKWPPNKAWTSINLINGQRHFVVINYGIDQNKYFVNLVSVIDSNICFILNFNELRNKSLWIPGWQDFEKDITNKEIDFNSPNYCTKKYIKGCLHPSDDSGLNINSESSKEFRTWFPH